MARHSCVEEIDRVQDLGGGRARITYKCAICGRGMGYRYTGPS